MPSSYFISDLHLDRARPELTRALERFLIRHRGCDALYILGDLFEAWIGDDDDAALATQTAHLLRSFSHSGSKLYLMHGNRDFLLGQDFCLRTGATLLPDPIVIELYGIPTLLMHGDSLCTDDVDYQQFRRLARSSAWQADLLERALPERRALALQLRSFSHEAKSGKPSDITDVALPAVQAAVADHGVTQLIHGHTHRPGRYRAGNAVRWVVGEWHREAWYLRADRSGTSLHFFNI